MSTLLERMPAVRRIDTDRRDAHAFEIRGEVTAADIENLYGLIEGALVVDPEIDLLLKFEDYEGAEWGEVLSGEASAAARHIRRTAIVGGPDWIATAANFLTPFVSLDLKQFPQEREEEAWAFIGAAPA